MTKQPRMISKETLESALSILIKKWLEKAHHPPEVIRNMHLYRQIEIELSVEAHPPPIQVTTELLHRFLKKMEYYDQRGADIIRARSFYNRTLESLRTEWHYSTAQIHRLITNSVKSLVEFIHRAEMDTRAAHIQHIHNRLPQEQEHGMFGIDAAVTELLAQFKPSGGPKIISIEGLGGLGKTSLAIAVAEKALAEDMFYDIGWLSVKQYQFSPLIGTFSLRNDELDTMDEEVLITTLLHQFAPNLVELPSLAQKQNALQRRLKRHPHLIILDNLETVDEVQILLPFLRRFTNPSVFLLTSRETFTQSNDVYNFSIPELDLTSAQALMNVHQANLSNDDAQQIYNTVGGHPLALKLVMGQMAFTPLEVVLQNLQQAYGRKAHELYHFIYWQAWESLSEEGRQLLLAMPLASGGDFSQLQAVTRLPPFQISQAIEELHFRSLLILRSLEQEDKTYTIHRLTETFLIDEVLRW